MWGLSGSRWGRSVQLALVGCLVLLFPGNLRLGLKLARHHRQEVEAFEQDLAAGMPPFALVRRNGDFLVPEDSPERPEFLTDGLEKRRRAGARPLRDLPRDPSFRKIPVPIPGGRETNCSLTVQLKEPQLVYLICLTYTGGRPADVPQPLQVTWKRGDQRTFPEAPPAGRLTLKTPEEENPRPRTVAAWVNETIDQCRVDWKDPRLHAHLAAIVLYVPADGSESPLTP
jgi:hypothetical protein